MDKCKKCGQSLELDDKFCRNCGQPVEVDEETGEKLSQETIVPNKPKNEDDIETLDISIVEKARKEEIRREIEELKNREAEIEKEEREYKEYDLEKTQIIGDINEYIDDEAMKKEAKEYKREPKRDYRPVEENYYEEEYYEADNKDYKKKLFIGLGIGFVILVAVLAIFFMKDKKQVNKEELIEKFVKALDNRNESELVGLLSSTDPDLKIDKKGIHAYFKYIDENPSYIEKVKSELEEQSKFYDESKRKDIGERFENIVMRHKDGKYFLDVKPYYLKVKVPAGDVELYLDDEKIDTTSTDRYEREFGPFMPGIYELKGKILSSGENEDVMEKVILFDDKPDVGKVSKVVELDLKLVSFKIETDSPEAFIVINGEKTSSRVKDLPGGTFGPISKSTKLQISLDTPFGEMKSKEVSVADINGSIKLDIDFKSEGIIEGITKAVNTFIKEDAKAMETLDGSVYTNLLEPELSNRKQTIEEMKDLNQSIESKINKITYDLNSLNIKESDGKYYSSIVVKTDLEQTFFTEFSVDSSTDPKYGEYTLVYNLSKKLWEINSIENASNFDLANTKEFKF